MSNVAILIPAYNCETYVEATLKSLMGQGDALRTVDRIILTDDCSKDRTIEVARLAWKGPIPLEVFDATENRGEYKNMNEAVACLPKYIEWFLIMHADNLAKPGWLATLLDRVAAADEKIGTISTSWDNYYEDGRVVPGENRQPPTPERIRGGNASVAGTILKGCWWHISSCAIRVEAYREVGGLPLGLRLTGDWDLLLRLLGCGWDVEYVPTALMTYRANPTGSSSVSFERHRDVFETLRVAQRHQEVLSIKSLVGYHGHHFKTLVRRFVGGVVRGRFQRALATIPMAFFTLRSLGGCLRERALGWRCFYWVSSSDPANGARLSLLSVAMERFYSQPVTRDGYQRMIDSEDSAQPLTEGVLRQTVLDAKPSSVLEVGCGSGRIYQRLREQGYQSAYIGIEMAPEVIAENRRRFHEATWVCGSGYNLPVTDASQDCVFAYYVLEHCIFPELFLLNLLRAVRPGGSMILAFPDFAAVGLFGSQRLGISEGNARVHLTAGRLLHALVALYDSRVRLPRALRQARQKVGPFPVNLRPKCLEHGVKIEPDVDAIYLASREEIVEWANDRGLEVLFPGGQKGILGSNVLIQLKKPASAANAAADGQTDRVLDHGPIAAVAFTSHGF
jgi:glycosyltransferase involved in cell wall biosynthesis/SAM-dependent methyltransferase